MTRFENWRLGPRRFRREYSLHQRGVGPSCGEITKYRSTRKLSPVLQCISVLCHHRLITARQRGDETRIRKYRILRSVFTVLGAIKLSETIQFNIPYLNVVNRQSHIRVEFNSFDDLFYEENFSKFTREQLIYIHDEIRVPPFFIINEPETKHKAKFNGVHAFLYWLYHWFSPSQRVVLDQHRWGYDYSYLSKVFNAVNKWMLNTHGHRLHNFNLCQDRLQYFNELILQKVDDINSELVEQGQPLLPIPNCLYIISLFADCTRLRTCKPGVN